MLSDVIRSQAGQALVIAPSHQAEIKVLILEFGLETCLANRIRVYGDPLVIQKISDLVNKFEFIWKLSDFVQIWPERCITMLLHTDWQSSFHTLRYMFIHLIIKQKLLLMRCLISLNGKAVWFILRPIPFSVFRSLSFGNLDLIGKRSGGC